MLSSARTAPANRRWCAFSAACIGPTAARSRSTARICRFSSPHDAIAAGIVTIPQELRLVPALSVAENLTLGDPPVRARAGLSRWSIARACAPRRARALAQLDFAPDPDARVDRLSFAERQLVAIAKALRRHCRVLILDEPTAALETREIERLFAVLARMKAQGTAIVYVSHRLDEVVALADRCTVLRDGRVAATQPARRLQRRRSGCGHDRRRGGEDLQSECIGTRRRLLARRRRPTGPTPFGCARAKSLGWRACSAAAPSGVLRRLFGVGGERDRYSPRWNDASGSQVRRRRSALGIGMVPGERRLGLIMNLSVRDNILLPSLDALARRRHRSTRAGDRAGRSN